jgi:hypothetical protein
MAFVTQIMPLYNEQVDVFLMMTSSLSSVYLILQGINKMRQRELNPGIKDFDEKIPIIANLAFSLVIALFNPQNLNAQQRYNPLPLALPPNRYLLPIIPLSSQNIYLSHAGHDHQTDGV